MSQTREKIAKEKGKKSVNAGVYKPIVQNLYYTWLSEKMCMERPF